MRFLFFLFFVANSSIILMNAQTAPFQISIEPMEIDEVGGVQSFSNAQYDGKWLIIGGRLDGLHQRQPWASFDESGNNNELIVIDPIEKKKWSAPLTSLPLKIQEQLSSTNMEFFQEGDMLYIIGGYGYSSEEGDHVTYPYLTAIQVPDVIEAVIDGTLLDTYFRQITDQKFAVTGGYLNKIYDTYYLTGGQRFDGRYNPMNNPTFVQEYTNSIRKFTIEDDGDKLSVTHIETLTDEVNLHRRDYNVVPQIMPDGQEGLTAFSGVFQIDADLPFLNCVNIDSSGYTVNNEFSQYFNHYHCAQIPIYSEETNEMHTVFFGGIAQYYENEGILVQDNEVPFVKTIARVTRDANGIMTEFKLPIEMPSFLGASSEFMPVEGLPEYDNGVLNMDDFSSDTTHMGYIYGGINSSEENIFWINDGTQSIASSQIFKVFIIKNSTVAVNDLHEESSGSMKLKVYPNPGNGDLKLNFFLKSASDVKLSISDSSGALIENTILRNLKAGANSYSKSIRHLVGIGVYFVTLETTHEKTTQKIIIRP